MSAAFETRCPNGKKVIQYKRAKLEKWAPYLNSNGLMCRLTTYEDLECKAGSPGREGRRAGFPSGLCDLGHVPARHLLCVWAPADLCAGKGGTEAGGASLAVASTDRAPQVPRLWR